MLLDFLLPLSFIIIFSSSSFLETDSIKNIKALQQLLRLVNYARLLKNDLGKLIGPLYSKLGLTAVKSFNKEDIMQVEKIKKVVKKITRP